MPGSCSPMMDSQRLTAVYSPLALVVPTDCRGEAHALGGGLLDDHCRPLDLGLHALPDSTQSSVT